MKKNQAAKKNSILKKNAAIFHAIHPINQIPAITEFIGRKISALVLRMIIIMKQSPSAKKDFKAIQK